jgi:hypothetical protein
MTQQEAQHLDRGTKENQEETSVKITGILNWKPPKLKSEVLTVVPTCFVNLKKETMKSISCRAIRCYG